MRCFAAAGEDLRLTHTSPRGDPEETDLGDEIVQHAQSLSEACGLAVTMIVIDHARLAMAGDPNNAEHVTQLTRVLTSIAQRTGAAVFLLAHSPKNVTSKQGSEIGAADIAGSSAFVDNARSAFMLYSMREDEAKTFDREGQLRPLRYSTLAQAHTAPQLGGCRAGASHVVPGSNRNWQR
jgi:RecA-family ATPase